MYDLMVKDSSFHCYHAREEGGGDFGSGLSIGVMKMSVALLRCINCV